MTESSEAEKQARFEAVFKPFLKNLLILSDKSDRKFRQRIEGYHRFGDDKKGNTEARTAEEIIDSLEAEDMYYHDLYMNQINLSLLVMEDVSRLRDPKDYLEKIKDIKNETLKIIRECQKQKPEEKRSFYNWLVNRMSAFYHTISAISGEIEREEYKKEKITEDMETIQEIKKDVDPTAVQEVIKNLD